MTYISDKQLAVRWLQLKRYLTKQIKIYENNTLRIEADNIVSYLSKKSQKFRIKSHLDWVYYTPKTLADAINHNQVEAYYEFMHSHPSSDPNIWKDKDFEQELKSYYAAREGRASLI